MNNTIDGFSGMMCPVIPGNSNDNSGDDDWGQRVFITLALMGGAVAAKHLAGWAWRQIHSPDTLLARVRSAGERCWRNRESLAEALGYLREAHLLTPRNVQALIKYAGAVLELGSLTEALRELQRAHLLTQDNPRAQDNFRALIEYAGDVGLLVGVLGHLGEDHLLTQRNFRALIEYRGDVGHLAEALWALQEARLLVRDNPRAQENFQALIEYAGHRGLLSRMLWYLYSVRLLVRDNPRAQENFQALIGCAGDIGILFEALGELQRAALLTQDNFTKIVLLDTNLRIFLDKIAMLGYPGHPLLNQEEFNRVVDEVHEELRTEIGRHLNVHNPSANGYDCSQVDRDLQSVVCGYLGY